jgi:putative salt-induced outer membrane protein YdiY
MLPKHIKRTLFTFVAATLFISSPLLADEVRMKNGDIIKGTVIKKETDKLIFRTSYAGDLQIQWSEVENLVSEKPVYVVLSDGSKMKGPLIETLPGSAKIELKQTEEELEESDFDLMKTRYLNPTPDLTGEGIRWTGNINAGGTLTEGNTETKQLRFDAETIARTLNNRFTVGGIFNRAQSNDNDYQFNSRGYGKYDHFLSKQWYLYANTTLENDRFRDIRLRSTIGGGSGYQVFETPNLNLSFEGGLNYIKEDYYLAQDDSYPGVRWATKYDQLFFTGSTRFFHEHEVLVGIKETNQILVFTKTGLRFPLVFNFNATAQFNFNWDNTPAAGRKREDSTLMFTLGYGW